AVEGFGPEVALATGFGAEGCVLVAMLSSISPGTRIFYLDTDLLFPETYALRDKLEARYAVRFERRATSLSLTEQAAIQGERLWLRLPDECCRLRKVEPLREMLAGLRAWITGIRRDQSPTRATARIVEWDDQFGLIKINPLAAWSASDVWNYITRHDVPYNSLHDQGYPSIGCVPCTTPVQIGETQRSGRWRNIAKSECGLHQPLGSAELTKGIDTT
ncbi:MAG: phosphoadenylyl-sulfate reductase, partial [Pyrinomonadaceae bacterium]